MAGELEAESDELISALHEIAKESKRHKTSCVIFACFSCDSLCSVVQSHANGVYYVIDLYGILV